MKQLFISCCVCLLSIGSTLSMVAQNTDTAAQLDMSINDYFVIVMSAIAGIVLVATIFLMAKAITILGKPSNKNIHH